MRGFAVVIFAGFVLSLLSGCSGDERLAEKARIEGREQAKAELQAQIDNLGQVEQRARAEGRVQAEEQLRSQVEHIDQVIARARAEGRATAEADISAQNENLARRSQEMEADLAIRHRFYQAVRGDYEGTLRTEQGNYSVRVTLVPSLPLHPTNRIRQLDEIISDLNNLYLNAQIVQWNPSNRLSAVGCRVEHVRPDIINGEITIASEACPNLYSLKLAAPIDSQPAIPSPSVPNDASASDVPFLIVSSSYLAASIREGRVSSVGEIRGEVHPTTNAAVYQLSVSRVSRR